MDYQQAKDIRKKSFGTMLAEEEGGLFSSLGKTISKKNQARMTGLKEKFDPLNMAKFVTGGSNWAPAMLGKMFGVDKKRVDYFSGVKHRNKNTADKLGPVGGGEGSFTGILLDIEKLLHDGRDEDKLQKEKENAFAEEKEDEKNRRHKELMEAISGKKYTIAPKKTATKIDNPEETPSGLDLSDMMATFKMLKDAGGWLTTLLLGPVGLAAALSALIIGGVAIKGSQEVERYRELGGDDAADLAAERQTDEFLGAGDPGALGSAIMNANEETKGEKLTKLVKKKQEIIKTLMENEGFKKLGEDNQGRYLFKDSKNEPPNPELLKTVNNQANLYLKSNTLPETTKAGNQELPKESPELSQKNSPEMAPATPKEASVPVSEAPKSGAQLNQVQKENIDLNIPVSKPDPSTVVNNNVNSSSSSSGNNTRGPIPLVRNAEETLQRMILNSTRIV
jgi:hypothetical protein